jgi:hypothetical protein
VIEHVAPDKGQSNVNPIVEDKALNRLIIITQKEFSEVSVRPDSCIFRTMRSGSTTGGGPVENPQASLS